MADDGQMSLSETESWSFSSLSWFPVEPFLAHYIGMWGQLIYYIFIVIVILSGLQWQQKGTQDASCLWQIYILAKEEYKSWKHKAGWRKSLRYINW